MLIGEPFWRREPPDQATIEACHATTEDDFRPPPDLLEQFGDLGCDVVEMLLADQDSWDRYAAAHWLNTNRWLAYTPTMNWPRRCARNWPPHPLAMPDTNANTSAGRLRADEPLTAAAE